MDGCVFVLCLLVCGDGGFYGDNDDGDSGGMDSCGWVEI
jgi:hypothetical protein